MNGPASSDTAAGTTARLSYRLLALIAVGFLVITQGGGLLLTEVAGFDGSLLRSAFM